MAKAMLLLLAHVGHAVVCGHGQAADVGQDRGPVPLTYSC